MKKKLLRVVTLAMLLMSGWSCGGGGDDAPSPVPSPPRAGVCYGKTVVVEAFASEVTVELTGLTSAVRRSTGSASWLTATLVAYISGTPKVKVSATENSEWSERQQDLAFYTDRDTLVLTVVQSPFDGGGGTNMDRPHDTPSDEPAFSRVH